MQALILAGGMGTRLRSVLGDSLNKPMAPIAGRPFLEYLVMWLRRQNVRDIVLCVGYKSDLIQSHFGQGDQWDVRLSYSCETTLLGTGGAIKLAQKLIHGDEFFVLNGDSFFNVDLNELARYHRDTEATATLALAQVDNAQRYGAVNVDKSQRIRGFVEKGTAGHSGLINGGIYLFTQGVLDMIPSGEVYSLERDVFPALVERKLCGHAFPGFFIDIGVPADYERLQADPTLVNGNN